MKKIKLSYITKKSIYLISTGFLLVTSNHPVRAASNKYNIKNLYVIDTSQYDSEQKETPKYLILNQTNVELNQSCTHKNLENNCPLSSNNSEENNCFCFTYQTIENQDTIEKIEHWSYLLQTSSYFEINYINNFQKTYKINPGTIDGNEETKKTI